MEPALAMAGLWLLFAATHIGLATRPLREPLVRRLGERGFTLFFSLIAAVTFTLLVSYYAAHRDQGLAALALGGMEPARWALMVAIGLGAMLVTSTFASYPRSPYALWRQSTPPPRGIERITRHPFFVGVAIFAVAHALLATRLIGVVFIAGLATVGLVGAWHQDRKLLAKRGEPYAEYLRATSTLPFAAILAGRQRLVVAELPFVALGAGIVLTFALRALHESIFSNGGMWLIGATLAGAVFAAARSWRQRQRPAEHEPAEKSIATHGAG